MTNRMLAKKIVRELMTVYCGRQKEIGTRLVIMKGNYGHFEKDLGGLCRDAAEGRVKAILDAKQQARKEQR